MKDEHSELVKDHFNLKYHDYDILIRKLIPRYEEMHQTVLNQLNFSDKSRIRILDLGIGTGETALRILEKFSYSFIDGFDISKKMIEQAKIRLKDKLGRVTFFEKDISELNILAKYDAVISVLCIHHLNPQQKQELFYKIFNCLNKSGIFIIADIIKFDSVKETKKQEEIWKTFLISNLGKNDGNFWFENYKQEDLPDSVNAQISWLKNAGFNETGILFENMNYAVFYGKKN